MGRVFDWFASLDRRVLYGGAATLAAGIVVLSLFAFGVFGGGSESSDTTIISGTTTATTDAGGTTDDTTTTLPISGRGDSAILTVTGATDGSTLPVLVGTEVTVRLAAEIDGDLWRITTAPDQEVLAFGGSIFFVPSEPDEAEPYQEFTFTARNPGTTEVVIRQGSEDDDSPTFGFTVTVIDA